MPKYPGQSLTISAFNFAHSEYVRQRKRDTRKKTPCIYREFPGDREKFNATAALFVVELETSTISLEFKKSLATL